MTPFADAGRAYAARGLHVLPAYPLDDRLRCACSKPTCASPGKHALAELVPHGLLDATTDSAVIEQWGMLWPDANLAIRTGAVSGIVVLDVDADKSGWESAARLEAEYGPWPATPTVVTGGGGAHLYFRHPGSIVPNSVGRIAAGIDVRGDNAYVVAPESSHTSGNHYQWAPGFSLDDLPFADLPGWVRQRIAAPSARQRDTRLAEDEVLGEGGRNDRLMRLGAAFRRYGLAEGEIAAALHVVNATRCRPPLDRSEVDKIAASVSRYQPAPPQSALVRPTGRFEYRHGQVVQR